MEHQAREHFPNTMAAYEGLVITDFPCEPTESPDEDFAEIQAAAQAPDVILSQGDATVRSGATFLSLTDPAFRAGFGNTLSIAKPDSISSPIWNKPPRG